MLNWRNVRMHWKKVALASLPIAYGLNALKSNYEISKYMRTICNEVKNSSGSSKNVLVILNPVADKKNSEKMFRSFCEPILHLSGFTVDIKKTKHVGHAKTLVESLISLPDVIIVAGGDGTSSEVVTGLLRRGVPPCPIVLLPLGEKSNTALRYLQHVPSSKLETVKCLISSLQPLIEDRTQFCNVVKYDIIDSDAHEVHKPIYGLQNFSWGLLRDIEAKQYKYWYFGYLRHHAAALFNAFSDKLQWNIKAKVVLTPPCPGCSNCKTLTNQKPKISFASFYTTRSISEKSTNFINEFCKVEKSEYVEMNQIDISCIKNSDSFFELKTDLVKSLTPGFNFLDNISKVVHQSVEPAISLRSRTIKLYPSIQASTYYIDGEEYDVRPIKISLIPNAIKLFC
ncbi:acylglycerol kinase, mitochondrial [Glossina fuscipes]|uniref:Acylglycerol kinase, mitochondrial n=1 Tax=Glossina fuscipes TaxID=7396 RepID=A0A9C5ZKC1_9MUSC|nr:acylglycerol kinase, mitochondrial [Glossina fuscipes]